MQTKEERLEQLQEKYPSDDPLTLLYTWPHNTREKVTKALKPYVRIVHWSGEIQWLVSPSKEGDQLAEDVELLARAASWELLGFDKQFRLSEDQAEDLANDILNAGKNAI
jgi:hypothetical protein